MFNPSFFNFLSTDLTKPTYSAQPGEAFDCPEHGIKLLFHLLNLYFMREFLLAEQVLSKTLNCSKVPLLYMGAEMPLLILPSGVKEAHGVLIPIAQVRYLSR